MMSVRNDTRYNLKYDRFNTALQEKYKQEKKKLLKLSLLREKHNITITSFMRVEVICQKHGNFLNK